MDTENKIIVGVMVVFIICGLVFTISQPYFEAKNFNKCTGSNVGYFDAVFNELRILDCNIK